MSGTPRLGSSYPSTPDSGMKKPASNERPTREFVAPLSSLLSEPRSVSPIGSANAPLIPLTVLDGPSQRFYVFALYTALLGWRLYDWGKLVDDEADSLWLFIKWVATDAVFFLYGLPALRVPWLEWSNPGIMAIFLMHAVLNGMLMFRIPIPLEAFLAGLVKTMYDRELSISENRVKPASILHNSSIIMGKHIINILPEGSATLNGDRHSFCIDKFHQSARLPILLNDTDPVYIELFRLDFYTNANETIEIKRKEVQALKKVAAKRQATTDAKSLLLEYAVKKPGLYRLHKVLDESNLEVQLRMSDTLVVDCPKAFIKPSKSDRCIGDLSDLTIEVQGIPPLKIVYRRTVNTEDQSFHFQSIQPEKLISPLLGSNPASTLVSSYDEDMTWARSHSIEVRLNESMTTSGKWRYSIDAVHDATGNVANFSSAGEDDDHVNLHKSKQDRSFAVHERPVVRLNGCDTYNPLKVPYGVSAILPLEYGSVAESSQNTGHTITWEFSPIEKLTTSGEHGDDVTVEEFMSTDPSDRPKISQAGLYTMKTIKSQFCEGEIKEPAACLLLNPPEPHLSITSEDIFDKCAGNSIGLLVDVDLIGTPPFILHYEIIRNKQTKSHMVRIDSSRHQLELKPTDAGHFTYRFTAIDDHVYGLRFFRSKALTLEQDVKPPASAHFIDIRGEIVSCIEERVHVKVLLQGEPPFTLEYELVHNGKRKKQKVTGIEQDMFVISTEPLFTGGDYALALASVQDKTGCRIFLSNEVNIAVRQQRPKASFGLLDAKPKTMGLEGERIRLPLRLEGVPPWHVRYRRIDDTSDHIFKALKHNTNDFLEVDQRGLYEIVNVSDSHCPGTVDRLAATFQVDWIPRPEIKLAENAGLIVDGDRHSKREVCEGDIDALELSLIGSPPYHLAYNQRFKPSHRSQSLIKKELDVALGVASISMDTTKAGIHTYEFSELSDNYYNHDARSQPLIVDQQVNPKPSAAFSKPGHSYTYCKAEEAGDEAIPINLLGKPPFSLEIDIKHQSSSRPETIKIANIETNHHEFRIPHRVLSLGTHHVNVRKVRDSLGCYRKTENGASHVQVQVFDVPTIYPLETRTDYCVGERISYSLSGTPPFEIFYVFEGVQRKAKSASTNFRRIAERPGEFIVTAVSDKASECKASVDIAKTIHEMPSVKVSKGKKIKVDIHEGKEAEILFEFWGTPPFEFTYTRSTNAKKGQKSRVLETRHEISHEHSKTILSSQEGTYEVVAIKDKYCAFSTQRIDAKDGQKLLDR